MKAGVIGEPIEIVEIPQPAPADPPLTLPETWPETIPEREPVPA